MKLDRFNQYGRFIEFSPAEGAGEEIHTHDDGRPVTGFGDLLGTSWVAVVAIENRLMLYLEETGFELGHPSLELRYEHQADGTSLFAARDSLKKCTDALSFVADQIGTGRGCLWRRRRC